MSTHRHTASYLLADLTWQTKMEVLWVHCSHIFDNLFNLK